MGVGASGVADYVNTTSSIAIGVVAAGISAQCARAISSEPRATLGGGAERNQSRGV